MSAASVERSTQQTITTNERRQIVAALRAQALDARSDVSRSDGTLPLHGVVIETAYEDRVTSLVALADGSVSWYVSDGNGCLGCGNQSDVRREAAILLHAAEEHLPLCGLATERLPPPPGNVRCFFLTPDNVLLAEIPLAEVTLIGAPLFSLYTAGLRVVQTIERTGAGIALDREIERAMVESSSCVRESEAKTCLSVGNVVRRLRT